MNYFSAIVLGLIFGLLGMAMVCCVGYRLHQTYRSVQHPIFKTVSLPFPFKSLFFYQNKKNGILLETLIIESLGYAFFFFSLISSILFAEKIKTFYYSCFACILLIILISGAMEFIMYKTKKAMDSKHK